jgi:hypothetical protein
MFIETSMVFPIDSGGIVCFVLAQINKSPLKRAGEVVWVFVFHHAEALC